MDYDQIIYLFLLSIILVLGFRKWNILQPADKVIIVLIGLTLLQETAAFLCYKYMGNNIFTYHIYSPIEFFLLCMYFNQINRMLKRKNIGLLIGIAGIAVGIINTSRFQSLMTFNSYYLLFEGTIIIILCLLTLCDILLSDSLDFNKRSYFWVTLALMLYWSITYTGWGIFNLLDAKNTSLLKTFTTISQGSNIVFYLSIGLIFTYYKKFIPATS
jgi:hypothetical protein